VHLPRSTNRIGGAQFSYSFWLRKGVGTEQTLKNKIIFYRGHELKVTNDNFKRGYIYDRANGDKDQVDNNVTYQDFQKNDSNDAFSNRFLKCPLIRFGSKPNTLRIEFNSFKNPHLFVDLDTEVFSLLKSSSNNPHFNFIAFSIQDNFDFGGVERGIKVDVYVDDALVKTQSFENNALYINEGPIVLFASNRDMTETKVVDADIGDLTYYNYALQTRDVDNLYAKGVKNKACELPNSYTRQNWQLRKINLYNETKQI
jgi:hypothetical protein